MESVASLRSDMAILDERRQFSRVHCTLEELDTYYRGMLSADRKESIAEHLADCEDCTFLLLYGVIQPNGNDDPAVSLDAESEAELEKAWNQLRPRLKTGDQAGRPLANRLSEGPLPIREALQIALETSRALAGFHGRGRVLADLRAENLLIDSAGKAQFLDFGFGPTPESFEIGFGQPAEVAMSDLYRFLSPEQVARERLDQRSNLFSFGVLLYEMMTGASPFRGSTPLDTASRILSLEPASAGELNPEVGSALSTLIDRLLSKSPEDRPPSAAAVVCELEAICADQLGPIEGGAEPDHIESQIERLYDEIISLIQEEVPSDRSTRDDEIERAYIRLRELQTIEAEQFRVRFEESLNMPIDAGERILARARALRKKLEDFASQDPASQGADDSQTST